MNVITGKLADRRHYVHPENNRTLCGRTGRLLRVEGAADCGRCIQIIQRVDTSQGRPVPAAS